MLVKTRFGDCYIDEAEVVGIDRREYEDTSIDKAVYTVSVVFATNAMIMLEFLNNDDVVTFIERILKSKAELNIPAMQIEQTEEKTYVDGFKDGCEYTLKLNS